MPTRKEKLLQFIDPASQVGAEIGSLDKPTVTREMGQIHHIDHDTTCHFILKLGGLLALTASMVRDLITCSRHDVPSNYHGAPKSGLESFLIYMEYCNNAW